jgi:putative ATP-dependent endonuclease of the OLD family
MEQQVFKDLPWDGVRDLLQYAKERNTDAFDSAFSDYISKPVKEWDEIESLRLKIISEFKAKSNGDSGKKWFKAVHHGEALGDIIFKHFSEIGSTTRLKNILTNLSDWIDA